MLFRCLLFASLLFTFTNCAAFSKKPAPYPRLETVTVHSPGLRDNLLGDSPDRPVTVYLPPSYTTTPKRRYPTVYLLHGYGLTQALWTGESIGIQHIMDKMIAQGEITEMILVMPNANNRYGGSFYHNSATTGAWEDFITNDLVRFIDARYRTITDSQQRGIAGHSMGGHGALHLAFEYPQVFSAVYAFNPCCLGFGGGIGMTQKAWWQTLRMEESDDFYAARFSSRVQVALAAALAPAPKTDPFLAEFPFKIVNNKLQKNHQAYYRWEKNLPLHRIERNLQGIKQLQGIYMDAGKKDFPHIPVTTQLFSDKLMANGIPHQYDIHEGGHFNQVQSRIKSHMLPFFSQLFSHVKPKTTVIEQ